MSRLAADDPSHRGIMAQPLGVVDVLVSGKPTEHRLPQHADQSMPAVLARAGVGENFGRHRGKTERIVEFPICEQPGVGSHHRSAELKRQAAVEIDPERPIVRFTRRVCCQGALKMRINA